MRLTASRNDPWIVQDRQMIIEEILFLIFVDAVGPAIVKVYEWRQDVLYGPYIQPADRRWTR